MIIQVVGAGGLLGSSVVRRAHEHGHTVLVSSNVPWSDVTGTLDAIRFSAQELRQAVTESDGD